MGRRSQYLATHATLKLHSVRRGHEVVQNGTPTSAYCVLVDLEGVLSQVGSDAVSAAVIVAHGRAGEELESGCVDLSAAV